MLRLSSFLIIVTRTIRTSCRCSANHYDILGITPKATQNEIKTAYYKLSKIHHPDKSKDEESAKMFRNITEAYEVLGNIQLKKMYDRGLLGRDKHSQGQVHYHPEPEPTDPTVKFYKSRMRRQVTPTMNGETPTYNFDEWAKEHYGNIFKKAKFEQEHLKKKLQKRADEEATKQQEALLYVMLAIGGVFLLFVVNGGTSEYDKDRIKHEKKDNEIREIKKQEKIKT